MVKIHVAAGLLLALAACAEPTLNTPTVVGSEIETEGRRQEQISSSQRNVQSRPVDAQEARQRLRAVAPPILAAGESLCAYFQGGATRCRYDIVLENNREQNAYADGNTIHITTGMIGLAQAEEELAFVIAHEFAHNLLGHVASTQQNMAIGSVLGALIDGAAAYYGTNTGGVFSDIGGQAAVLRYSVGFEREADYLGLYIADRAGYDITKAPYVWRKMSAANPDSIYLSTTHPANAERFVAMNKTIEEIFTKKQKGAPLLPDIRRQ